MLTPREHSRHAGFYRAGGGNGICSQCVGDELITVIAAQIYSPRARLISFSSQPAPARPPPRQIALIFLLGVTACMLACCLCHLHTRRKARGRPLMSCASSGWASTLWPFFIQGIDPTRAEASFKSIITSVQMIRSEIDASEGRGRGVIEQGERCESDARAMRERCESDARATQGTD